MLVLTRKAGEEIQIGREITITVLVATKNRIKVGISAPDDVAVMRGELMPTTRKASHRMTVGV